MSDADQLALFGTPQTARTSDDYWTPTYLFDLLGVRFDLDVACPPGGAPWVPADAYYDQEADGLRSPWWGRVWMNPPFSSPAPWADKFMSHANGIALLPVSKSKWCARMWERADGIVLMDPRLKFQQGAIFIPTLMAAFGRDNVEAIARVGHVR